MNLQHISGWLSIALGIGGVFTFVKTIMELSALPWTWQRNRYDFARSFAEKIDDPTLLSYATELGYMVLVRDDKLSTRQRAAILTLPNRSKNLGRYSKAKTLLTVHADSPVLSWRHGRHQKKWYRKGLMVFLWLVYITSAGLGSLALFYPYTAVPSWKIMNFITSHNPGSSICLICVGIVVLYHSVKISVAKDLIHDAHEVGPQPDPDQRNLRRQTVREQLTDWLHKQIN